MRDIRFLVDGPLDYKAELFIKGDGRDLWVQDKAGYALAHSELHKFDQDGFTDSMPPKAR